MPTDKDKIIELIQKCLRLSESSNENEAQVALTKAQELLEKYNLTMEQVRIDNGSNNSGPELVNEEIGIYGRWQGSLLHCVAKNNFCRVVMGRDNNIYLLGRAPNVAAVIEMSTWIMTQLERLALDATLQIRGVYLDPKTKTFVRPYNDYSKRSFKTDFFMGAIARLNERFIESRQQRVEASVTTRALVVNLETEVRTFLDNQFPYRVARLNTIRNYSTGYRAGRNAADSVSLIRPSHHITDSSKYLNSGR